MFCIFLVFFFEDYYLYIDSSGRVKDDNARLFTEHLSKTSASCFSFYYHMYGATAGTLTLSMFSKGESNLVELFSKSGNQGDRWHSQRVDLTSVTDYQVWYTHKIAQVVTIALTENSHAISHM